MCSVSLALGGQPSHMALLEGPSKACLLGAIVCLHFSQLFQGLLGYSCYNSFIVGFLVEVEKVCRPTGQAVKLPQLAAAALNMEGVQILVEIEDKVCFHAH
jgi:hypothetical protein